MRFDYLIDKINDSDFKVEPFKHIYIENFFKEQDFNSIIGASEISLGQCHTDKDLFIKIFDNNYKVIKFPGCTTDYKKYIKMHSKNKPLNSHTACESSGIAVRLYPKNELLVELTKFFLSKSFNKAIADKFNIEYVNCNIDGGIQKYLDGYEISPHPDIRKKAATFMVNINPGKNSERLNYHTHYLKLNSEYSYVKDFWKANPKVDRQWVPWNWCSTKFLQTKNNSIVLFSPDNDTMHGVKADYDHLSTQRTQIYGNLWYKTYHTTHAPSWEQLLEKNFFPKSGTFKDKILNNFLTITFKRIAKKFSRKDPNISNKGY